MTTPEPTSVADAHAAISRFHQSGVSRLRVLVNQATTAAEAELVLDGIVSASRQFKGAVVSPLGPGFVRVDHRVQAAVRSRRPFVTAFPACCCVARRATSRPGRVQRATSGAANQTGGHSSGACRSMGGLEMGRITFRIGRERRGAAGRVFPRGSVGTS